MKKFLMWICLWIFAPVIFSVIFTTIIGFLFTHYFFVLEFMLFWAGGVFPVIIIKDLIYDRNMF